MEARSPEFATSGNTSVIKAVGQSPCANMFHLSSYLNFFPLLLAVLSSFFSAQATVPSPRATTELICHTNHASDCYPSIFQPTEEFQVVKDDQSLPPGLHVRMNLATGVKEARLNVPEPEATYSDLVIIDRPESKDESSTEVTETLDSPSEEPHVSIHHDQSVLSDPPCIRTPAFEPGELSTFQSSMSQLRTMPSSDPNYDPTPVLVALQDLCHSGEWGLRLTKDSNVTQLLVQSFSDVSQKLAVRSGAALLLATAIQNNPDALAAAISHFYNDEWPKGPLDAVLLALLHEQSTKLLIRAVFLLSTLCQDQSQLIKFVNAEGLMILLRAFQLNQLGDIDIDQPDHDKLRGKIANFIFDHLTAIDLSTAQPMESVHEPKMEMDSDAYPSTDDDDVWTVVETPKDKTDPVHVQSHLLEWERELEKASGDLGRKRNHESATALESVDNAKRALRKVLGKAFY